jgi:hypothetical protein
MMSTSFEEQALKNMEPKARRGTEEELFMLGARAPELVKDVPSIFKEAVMDALVNILDESTVKALEIFIGKKNLDNPSVVFTSLDSLLHEGAPS